MPLVFEYKKKSEVPDAHKDLYVEVEGVWRLDVDDVAPKAKLDEFRKTNSLILKALGVKDVTNLKDVLENLEKLKDVDPAEYERLKKEAKEADEKKLTSKGQYEQALETQRATMQADFDKKEKALQEKYDAAARRLEDALIDDAIVSAATKKGVKGTALDDVKARARRIYKLGDNYELKAFEGDAEKFGKDGKALKPDEWVEGLLTVAPHLFEPNNGSGGSGGGSGGEYHQGNNPYSAGTINLTTQGRLERENTALAKQLKASAKK